MSLSATLFGTNSLIFKATNILGLGIPGLLHKEFGPGEPEAQRLGEISRQTAKEAEPRVIVWGRVRPIGGNLIHCQEPIKRMIKQSSSGGGKGSGSKKQEQKVEHVFRSYAVGVCEAPITRFSRIWRNNKLVYDARGNEWGNENNPVFLKTFRLYLGGWNQMPDPTLESIWGAGQVPAYRGTAYMVSIDEDLTDMGGAVPQWQFEVERAEGIVVTSRPYSWIFQDNAAATFSVGVSLMTPPSGTSAAGTSDITFKASLRTTVEYGSYSHPIADAAGPSDITFKASLRTTVEYGSYSHPIADAAGPSDMTFKASLKTEVQDAEISDVSISGTFNVEVYLV